VRVLFHFDKSLEAKIQEQKSLCDLKKNNQGLNFKNVGRKLDIQLIFLTIICIPKS